INEINVKDESEAKVKQNDYNDNNNVIKTVRARATTTSHPHSFIDYAGTIIEDESNINNDYYGEKVDNEQIFYADTHIALIKKLH
ncbi:unnamed protein product, partial [Didymodactylos carnosus]